MLKKLIKGLLQKIGYNFVFIRRKKNTYGSYVVNHPNLNIPVAKYYSYDEYIKHQASKLDKVYDEIVISDQEYEKIVFERYKEYQIDFKSKTVLCLGARLGGEVRAFKQHGALAIGIDINPGKNNDSVLYGDFHNIKFPDSTFDFVFSNVIDHVLDIEKFSEEAKRILKVGGRLILECSVEPIRKGSYEVMDTTNLNPIIEFFKYNFNLVIEDNFTNKTNYVDWSGKLLIFQKK